MTERLQHLGLNLAYLNPGATGGMEVYARELVPALRRQQPDLVMTAFVNSRAAAMLQSAGWLDGVDVVKLRAGSSRLGWVIADQLAVPAGAKRARVDLLHSLASTAPAFARCCSVVTIHDLTYHHHPEAHSRLMTRGMSVLVPLAARRADRIITGASSVAADIERVLGVLPEKIDVIWHGVGKTAGETTEPAQVRRQFELGSGPLVLAVSAKRPHKNLRRLIEAQAQLQSEPVPVLVITGYPTEHERELKSLVAELGLEQRVRILGWVSNADLEGLYAAATCFVFPSLAEGFGLPVLEAMQRGVPVACADAGPLPEVAGEAALLFDPLSVTAIAAAIDRLLGDAGERERLIGLGLERVKLFDWDQTASLTLASYECALERH